MQSVLRSELLLTFQRRSVFFGAQADCGDSTFCRHYYFRFFSPAEFSLFIDTAQLLAFLRHRACAATFTGRTAQPIDFSDKNNSNSAE
jgi:hypothetical protein